MKLTVDIANDVNSVVVAGRHLKISTRHACCTSGDIGINAETDYMTVNYDTKPALVCPRPPNACLPRGSFVKLNRLSKTLDSVLVGAGLPFQAQHALQ